MKPVTRWPLIWMLAISLAVSPAASAIAADPSETQPAAPNASAADTKATAKAAKEAKAEKEARAAKKAEKQAKARAEKEAKAARKAEAAAEARTQKDATAVRKAEDADKAKAEKEAREVAQVAAEAARTRQTDKERAAKETEASGGTPAVATPAVATPAGATPSAATPSGPSSEGSPGSAPAATPAGAMPAAATPANAALTPGSASMSADSTTMAKGAPAVAVASDPKAEKKAKKVAAKAAKAAAAQAKRDARTTRVAAADPIATPESKKPKAAKPAHEGSYSGTSYGSTIAPLARRTSDETVWHDLALMDQLEARLAAMPATVDPWRVAGARKWIEAAREEYLDNDETGFDQESYARAAELVAALESGAAPMTRETVPVAHLASHSATLKPEMWNRLETMKRDEGFPCAAAELAMLEVELQWAGHEQLDTGECDSEPHLQAAQQHSLEAQALAASCRKPEPAPVVVEMPKVEVKPLPPVALQIPTVEELKVPRDVHFALAKDFVGVGSRKVIGGVVNILLKYPSVFVHLTGHTDSRGSYEYNLALSQRRVHGVYLVLREMGIDSSRITIEFVGKSKLYAAEVSTKAYALNRRVEMDFHDSEGREITAERTEADLQIESDRPVTPPAPTPKPKVRIRTPRAVVRDSAGAKPAAVKSTTTKPTASKPGTPPRTTIKTRPARPDSGAAGENR